PERSVERQLAHEDPLLEWCPARDLPRSEQERDRDRKVEAGALLSDVRGRQVDGDLSGRKLEAAVSKRREDALAAFPHGRVGQSHEREGRKSGPQVCPGFDAA